MNSKSIWVGFKSSREISIFSDGTQNFQWTFKTPEWTLKLPLESQSFLSGMSLWVFQWNFKFLWGDSRLPVQAQNSLSELQNFQWNLKIPWVDFKSSSGRCGNLPPSKYQENNFQWKLKISWTGSKTSSGISKFSEWNESLSHPVESQNSLSELQFFQGNLKILWVNSKTSSGISKFSEWTPNLPGESQVSLSKLKASSGI